MDTERLVDAILNRLQDPAETGASRGLATHFVDALLARPLGALVDPPRFTGLLLTALQSDGPGTLLQTHLAPSVATESQRAERAEESLETLLPRTVVDAILGRLSRPAELPPRWADGIVDPRFVQRILSEALATTLEEGFRSLPFGSGAGGVLGSLTRRAGRIPFANPFADQARALAQQSAESLRQRLMDQFEAPENAPEVAAMRARCADRLLALPTPQVLGLLNDPGWPTVAQWLRDVLAHNSAREAFQEAITEQVQSAFDRIGPDATLGEWLAPFELTTPFRSFLIDQSTELLVTLAGQTSLRQWLQNLLHSAKAE